MREIIVGATQIGPIQRADSRADAVARAETEGDELAAHACADAATIGKAIVFDLMRHRGIEHHGRITRQTDVIYPDRRPG